MPHNRIIIDDRTPKEKVMDAMRVYGAIARDIFGAGCLLVAVIGAYGWWNG